MLNFIMRCRVKRLVLGLLVTVSSYLLYNYVTQDIQYSGIQIQDAHSHKHINTPEEVARKQLNLIESPEILDIESSQNLEIESLENIEISKTKGRRESAEIVGEIQSNSDQAEPYVGIKETIRGYWERKGFAGTVGDDDTKLSPEFDTRSLDSANNKLPSVRRQNLEQDSMKDFLQRRVTLRNQCEQLQTNHSDTAIFKYKHIVSNRKFNLTYCFVPKAGCTFWKTIFYLLDKPDIKTAADFKKQLSTIRKNFIHNVPIPEYTHVVNRDPSFSSRSRNFLFTRDPYERLFSAYVDKLVLPYMWHTVGKRIVSLFRSPDSPDFTNDTCGSDVSFQEFLWYVIYIGHTGDILSEATDDHWTPVTNLCHPCRINYKYIGKMESFSRDRNFILKELQLSKLLANAVTSSDSARFATNHTIESVWYYVKTDWLCPQSLQPVDILNSVWKSFQYQGYLPFDLKLPYERLKHHISKSRFQRAVFRAYDENPVSAIQFQQRRRDALVRAYQQVPKFLLRHIQQIFKADFELFSYDEEPVDIFLRP